MFQRLPNAISLKQEGTALVSLLKIPSKWFEKRFAFFLLYPNPQQYVWFRKGQRFTILFSPFPQITLYLINESNTKMQEKSSMIINKIINMINNTLFPNPREAVKTMLIFKQMLFTYLNLHQHFGHPATFTLSHPLPFGNILPVNRSYPYKCLQRI